MLSFGRVVDQVLGCVPQLFEHGLVFGVSTDQEQPAEDADDVAIQNGNGVLEGDAANGSCGVTSDARYLQPIVMRQREFTAGRDTSTSPQKK